MWQLEIPGRPSLALTHLVLDFNGTLAVDGQLCQEVRQALPKIAALMQISVVTADTFGSAAKQLKGMPCALHILQAPPHDQAKRDYVRELGAQDCVAIGNGFNDRLMLQEAALGIAVMLDEGLAGPTLQAADLVCRSIGEALQLLLKPQRLRATLRA